MRVPIYFRFQKYSYDPNKPTSPTIHNKQTEQIQPENMLQMEYESPKQKKTISIPEGMEDFFSESSEPNKSVESKHRNPQPASNIPLDK